MYHDLFDPCEVFPYFKIIKFLSLNNKNKNKMSACFFSLELNQRNKNMCQFVDLYLANIYMKYKKRVYRFCDC